MSFTNHGHGNDPAACTRPGSDHKEEPPVAAPTVSDPEASRLAQPPGPEAVERIRSTVVDPGSGTKLADLVAENLDAGRHELREALKALERHGEPASSATAIHEAIAQVDSVMEALTGGERS